MLKKLAIGFTVVIVLVIGALLVIPFFISVDKFRPQIQAAVEKQIRGKVELGQLSLSLFPMIKVTIDGAKVIPPPPFDKEPLANIKSVQIKAPLTSLLTAPTATIAIVDADIHLVSQGPQKSSLTETLPPVEKNPPPQGAVSQQLNQLPGFVRSRVEKARFRFSLENANVSIKDLTAVKTDKTELHDLDVSLDNIGLSVPMKLNVSGNVDVVMGAIVVAGKIGAGGNLTFKPAANDNVVDLDVKADLAGLDIAMKPLFHKPAGTPFETVAQGTVIQNVDKLSANMKDLSLVFGQLKAGGTLQVLMPTNDPNGGTVDAHFGVNDFSIQSFGAMIPMIRDFKLNGKTDVAIAAAGSMTNPSLNVKVQLKNVSGATPQLSKPISDLNGTILVTGTPKNPTVAINPFSMKIGSSDLSVHIDVHGLSPISVAMGVNSNLINADELLGLQPLKIEPGKAAKTTSAGGGAEAQPVANQPLDESLNQLAPTVEEALKNPMLDQVDAKVTADVKKIMALGATFQDAALNLTYAHRKLNVSKSGLKGYGGLVYLALALDLDPKALGFDMSAGLKGIQVERALAAHMPGWKDVMTGTMNGDLKVSGKGLRKQQIASNLRGGLKGDVANGKLSFPIITLISGALQSIPKGLGSKVPVSASDKKKRFNGEFKTCALDTAIQGRMIDIKSMDVVFASADATDMGDVRFKATGNVNFDRQVDILGTAFLSPEIIRVTELKGPSGQIEIPLKVKGDISDPKPDYGYTAKIMGDRLLKGMASKAKDELKAKAQAEIKANGDKAVDQALKNAPAPVQKKADDIKKALKKFKF